MYTFGIPVADTGRMETDAGRELIALYGAARRIDDTLAHFESVYVRRRSAQRGCDPREVTLARADIEEVGGPHVLEQLVENESRRLLIEDRARSAGETWTATELMMPGDRQVMAAAIDNKAQAVVAQMGCYLGLQLS